MPTSSLGDNVSIVTETTEDSIGNNEYQPKFLVGIMHVTRDPWLSIVRDGQLPAWKQSAYKNFSFVYFFGVANSITSRLDSVIENMRWVRGRYASYGISYFLMVVLRPWLRFIPKYELVDASKSKVEAVSLRVKVPELTATMRWKKLAFLEYFVEQTNAEYVIISTSSSLINFEPIVKFVGRLSNSYEPVYAGRILSGYDCEFTSGSFTVLNRKSVRMLLENKSLIPVHVMDDIGFGTAFKKMGVNPVNLASIDLDSTTKVNETPDAILQKTGHFRFKSGSHNSRTDASLMQELMSKLQN
jgi:hypothetical protein